MQNKAGIKVQKLHGCVRCHKHVWTETDKTTVCPICREERYDLKGKAKEEVRYFPIKPRLEALLRDSITFQEAVEYEKHRPCPRNDVMAGMTHSSLSSYCVHTISLYTPLHCTHTYM